jgi:hypothetical protein
MGTYGYGLERNSGDGHQPSHHARQCRANPAALCAPPIHTVIARRSTSRRVCGLTSCSTRRLSNMISL